MNFSLVYLAARFFYRIKEFARRWFLGSFLYIGRQTINFLESLDQFFAWRITLRNLFQPLYQDHTVIGHGIAFIFRSSRLLVTSVVYIGIILLAAVIYLAWSLAPLYIIYRGFY